MKKTIEYWGQSPCANDAKTLEEVKKLRTDVTFCSSGLLYM